MMFWLQKLCAAVPLWCMFTYFLPASSPSTVAAAASAACGSSSPRSTSCTALPIVSPIFGQAGLGVRGLAVLSCF